MTHGHRFLIMAATVATQVSAEPLWQNLNSGMTLAQVKAAQPTAEPPATVSTLKGGASCDLAISDYVVQSDHFEVCFYMQSGRLDQVTMTSSNPSMPVYDTMKTLLRAKYEVPIKDKCDTGMMNLCEAEWLHGGVNVSLLYMDIGHKDPLVNINYQTRVKTESGKL